MEQASKTFEIKLKTKNSGEIPVEVSAHRFKLNNVFVMLSLIRDIRERKLAENQIRHLSRVLKSLRNIHLLITGESDQDEIIRNSCRILTENRGYTSAWIALVEDGRVISLAKEPDNKEHIACQVTLTSDYAFTPCMKNASGTRNVLRLSDPSVRCGTCNIINGETPTDGMITSLEYNNRLFGFVAVRMPPDIVIDSEEESLFKEIASDIAYALYNIDLENTRKEALEDLQKSESRYRSLFSHMINNFMYIKAIRDARGTVVDFLIVDANDAVDKISGKPLSHHPWHTTIGKTFLEVFPMVGEPAEYWISRFANILESKKTAKIKCRVKAWNTTIYVTIYSTEEDHLTVLFYDPNLFLQFEET